MSHDVLSRSEARERARLLSNLAYDVSLDLTAGGATFPSTTTARFSCAEPGAGTFIDFDVPHVRRAVLNGVELAEEAFTGSRLRLDDLREHNELVVEGDARYSRTGVGLHRFVDPVDDRKYLHTQFEPWDAHRVVACFDQPDLKARFSFSVHAPADWTVVSNSPALTQPAPGEPGIWRFAPTDVIAPYVAAVVAGPYAQMRDRHGDIDLGVYCRQSLAQHVEAEEIFQITKQGFDFFERAFGYPYPFGSASGDGRKYDQLFVPEFNSGAMENAACVTFSEAYVFRSKVTEALRERRAETILHEMAHMWFGDLVTMRWWDDLWLNESFATYMSYLAAVEATRFTNAWATFTSARKAWAYDQDQLPSTHPIVADIVDTDAVRVNFDGITYAKGASVLRQLVAWVGDDAFLSGLRTYFRRHEWGNAELGDFLAVLEESSGRELDAWSKEWLETAGVTTLRAASQVRDGRYEQVAVTQTAPEQHATLRSHRIGIGLYDHSGDGLVLRRRVELDVVGAHTEVPELAGERVPDLLLLNDGDLTFAKIRLDARSLETLAAHLGKLVDPLARSLCWHAVWDMTRDAELPARRFAQLVADHADGESDVGVLQTLLAHAHDALERFGDPANLPTGRAQLTAAAQEALEAAQPGSDFQLAWARFRIAVDDDPSFARGLLDGDLTVKGLAVDTELRWHIVGVLASLGAIDEDVITAEADRDATDMGARRAAAAKAALPTAEAKARAWDAVMQDDSLPLAMQRAIVAGFWQAGQDEVLREYVDRYVSVLESIWRDRTPEEALGLTGGLYPSTIIDEHVVVAADGALTLPGVPPAGRRIIMEARDETLRALRARALDASAAVRP